MKKIILFSILLLSLINVSFAQETDYHSQLCAGPIFFKASSESLPSFSDISGSVNYSYRVHKFVRGEYHLAYIPSNEDGSNRLYFTERKLLNSVNLSLFYPFPISPFIGAGIGHNLLISKMHSDIVGYDFDTQIDNSIGVSVIAGVDFFQNKFWGMRFFGTYSNGFFLKESSTVLFGIDAGVQF